LSAGPTVESKQGARGHFCAACTRKKDLCATAEERAYRFACARAWLCPARHQYNRPRCQAVVVPTRRLAPWHGAVARQTSSKPPPDLAQERCRVDLMAVLPDPALISAAALPLLAEPSAAWCPRLPDAGRRVLERTHGKSCGAALWGYGHGSLCRAALTQEMCARMHCLMNLCSVHSLPPDILFVFELFLVGAPVHALQEFLLDDIPILCFLLQLLINPCFLLVAVPLPA
jgi:hypothetical protein